MIFLKFCQKTTTYRRNSTSAMGDVAMTFQLLELLLSKIQTQKITVVSTVFKPFFDGIPNVDFFAVDVKERHKGFFGLLKLYSDLKKLNIDAVADLHNVLRSQIIRILFSLSGKKLPQPTGRQKNAH
jgi:ADP-heptose:LPS heptosyltransferase